MKLILTRHAKSAWDDPTIEDQHRSLNARGHTSAQAIGHWLNMRGHLPTHVLCSTAARARETFEIAAGEFPAKPTTTFEDALYLASPDVMLRHIRKQRGDVLMVVGHNPGIAFLADMLCATQPDHDAFLRYPTAATTVFQFDIPDWSAIQPGAGQPIDFIVPRELVA